MKNIVTFETAARIKAAGFPQPSPEPGQVWYNTFGAPYLIIGVITPEILFAADMDKETVLSIGREGYTFAPGPADILRELGGQYYLSIENGGAAVMCEVSDDWSKDIKQAVFTVRTVVFNTDPAEACALAWLEMKAQKL